MVSKEDTLDIEIKGTWEVLPNTKFVSLKTNPAFGTDVSVLNLILFPKFPVHLSNMIWL